jgi:SAM-dependent methyltransferase
MTAATTDQLRRYWDRQPCNVHLSSRLAGSREWSEELETRRYWSEPHIKEFAEFPLWAGKRVLEIGCGVGTDSLQFARHGAILDAVDASYESTALTRHRLWMHDYSVCVFCDNAEEWLPGEQNCYDLIYSYGVLHHTPKPLNVLRRAWTRLKAGGELRIMVYARGSLKRWQRWQPEAQAGCPLVRYYWPSEIRWLLETAGFAVRKIERRHIFKYVLADYLNHVYTPRPLLVFLGSKKFEVLSRYLGEHLLVYGGRS